MFRRRPASTSLRKTGGEIVEQVIRPTGLWIRSSKFAVPASRWTICYGDPQTVAKGERVLVTTLTKKLAEDLTRFTRKKACG